MPLDRPQLEQLYARMETPLYNVVYRWLWNEDEAQDVVQESFVRLWASRETVRLDTAQAFVYRIALNLAAKRRRAKKLWHWLSLEALTHRASSASSSERQLLSAEEDRQVQKAIDELPEALKRVVTLCELSDLSYEEVATVLEIPIGTVGSRRHTAFKALKQQLASFMEEPQ